MPKVVKIFNINKLEWKIYNVGIKSSAVGNSLQGKSAPFGGGRINATGSDYDINYFIKFINN